MSSIQSTKSRTSVVNFQQRLKEISMFFEGRDEVHKTMLRLVRRLEKAGIPHAVVGGMAVNAHGHRRTTGDVDVLLTAKWFEEFKKRFVPKKYLPIDGRKRRFIDRNNDQTVDFLITGYFPGNGRPGPISYPDPEDVREVIDKIYVIDLPTLIKLKLAARRYQDFADVVNLIGVHHLDESFADRLHPTLENDYIECLEEKRREDDYLAREG